MFEDDRPDLILMETLSLIRDLTVPTVQTLLDTGIPVWLSFRRCLYGPCGVYGQHWGGPEGDSFLRAALRFEEMGVGALLINCLPVDHVPGLPLGVYPNLVVLDVAAFELGAAGHVRMGLGDPGAELAQVGLDVLVVFGRRLNSTWAT